jgi:hypothetical protein
MKKLEKKSASASSDRSISIMSKKNMMNDVTFNLAQMKDDDIIYPVKIHNMNKNKNNNNKNNTTNNENITQNNKYNNFKEEEDKIDQEAQREINNFKLCLKDNSFTATNDITTLNNSNINIFRNNNNTNRSNKSNKNQLNNSSILEKSLNHDNTVSNLFQDQNNSKNNIVINIKKEIGNAASNVTNKSNNKNKNKEDTNLDYKKLYMKNHLVESIKRDILKKEDSLKMVCRICYEEETKEKGKILKPCKCDGSMKYIHEACLKQWIQDGRNIYNFNQCEVCKHKYKIKLFTRNKYSKQKCNKYCKSIACIMLCTFLTLLASSIIIYFLLINVMSMEDDSRMVLLKSLALTVSGLILTVLIFKLFSCKRKCFEKEIKEWKIYDYDGNINILIYYLYFYF